MSPHLRAVLCFGMATCVGMIVLAQTAPPPVAPPSPSLAHSPLQHFRTLLETNEAARAQMLAGRSPETRQSLELKIKEYLDLPPEPRELRLRLTELHWYLRQLLALDAGSRAAHLREVPELFQPLLRDRLQQWAKLPPEMQREFLQNEGAWQMVTRMVNSSPAEKEIILGQLSAAERQQVEASMKKWQGLSGDQRAAMSRQFFELSDAEQKQMLDTLPESERKRMEATLDLFQKLPAADRDKCIASFNEFAGMNAADREQFLRNAGRWAQMTAAQRSDWNTLVLKLRQASLPVPPMPPIPRSQIMPPMPPGMAPKSLSDAGH